MLSASARPALGQSGPFPPALGAYFWRGDEDFSGNGDSGDWSTAWWGGRYQIEAGNPPTTVWLPAEDGDALRIVNTFIEDDDSHHAISLGSHFLPSSTLEVEVYATYTGGSLTFQGIAINSIYGPLTFAGMSAFTDDFSAVGHTNPISFDNVSINTVAFDAFGVTGSPDPESPPILNFNNAVIDSSVFKLHSHTQWPYTAKLSDSVLTTLGIDIGTGNHPLANAPELRLDDAEAIVHQFLGIGAEGAGVLRLQNQSLVMAQDAYVNVGQNGEGVLGVQQGSTLKANELNIALAERGTVSVDSNGRIESHTAVIGGLIGIDGTVNLENGGRWENHDLTVGESGIGFVYVRDGGVLKIEGDGILGKNSTGRGVLNLIGADSQLELGESATFKIGHEGAGELHLSEGATFTSDGDVLLANTVTGHGTVTIDGPGSKWTVNGRLSIGEFNVGRVEVTGGGTLRVEGNPNSMLPTIVGGQQGADGTLVIGGAGATLEFGEQYGLVIGAFGKGLLEVRDGAEAELQKIIVGQDAEGEVKIHRGSANQQQQFKVLGDFTIGERNKGKIAIDDDSQVETTGQVVMAEQASAEAEINLNSLGARWTVSSPSTAIVGKRGTANVNIQSGGRFDVQGHVIAGENSGAHGNFTISQGGAQLTSLSVTSGMLELGKHGSSEVTLSGGGKLSASSGTTVSLGTAASGTGKITVEGTLGANSELAASGDLFVGRGADGEGTIEVKTFGILKLPSGAGLDDQHGTILGFAQDSEGTIDVLAGGLLTPVEYRPGTIIVGREGTGMFRIRGGKHEAAGTTFALGTHLHGDGTLDVAGADVELTVDRLDLARGTKAELKLSDHAELTSGNVVMHKGSKATVNASQWNVNIATFELAGELRVEAGGSLEINSGDFTTLPLSLGNVGATPQTIITGEDAMSQAPSTLTARHVDIGSTLVASMTVSNGARLTASGNVLVQGGSTLAIAGSGAAPSTATAANVHAPNGSIIVQGGVLETTNSLTSQFVVGAPSSLSVTFDGLVKARGLLQTAGTIETPLGGRVAANRVLITPGGRIDLSGGSMIVGGDLDSLPALPSNTLLVRAGGLLQGATGLVSNPSIKGKLIVQGNLIIGQSPGFLVVDGDVELQSGGALFMEIGGATPGTQFDQLQATGAVTLGGKLLVSLMGGGYLPTVGQQFTLFTGAGGMSGAFSNAATLNSIADQWRVDWSFLLQGGEGKLAAQSVALQADFDRSGEVDANDLSLWRAGLGTTAAATHAQGDADGDLDVDGSDFLIWQRQLGLTAPAAVSAATVPEPSALGIALVGLFAVAVRRRQI